MIPEFPWYSAFYNLMEDELYTREKIIDILEETPSGKHYMSNPLTFRVFIENFIEGKGIDEETRSDLARFRGRLKSINHLPNGQVTHTYESKPEPNEAHIDANMKLLRVKTLCEMTFLRK